MRKETDKSVRPAPALVRQPHPVRDNIEGLLTALVLALIIRHFVFEVFQIPTGSMAPTLLGQHRDLVCPNCGLPFAVDAGPNRRGVSQVVEAKCPNCGYELSEMTVRRSFCTCFPAWPQRLFWKGGNRVIVNKFLTHFRRPKRWDVVVFRKEQRNLIKRLVGLPGEEITVHHGDIFVNGKLQRKPPKVQEKLWQLVYDSSYSPRRVVYQHGPTWIADKGSLKEQPGLLELIPGSDGAAHVRYGPEITDFTAYNGSIICPEPPAFVGDLRWDIRVKLDVPGILLLNVQEDDTSFSAAVCFGDTGQRTSILASGEKIAECDFSTDVSIEHHIVFSNVDDRLELRVDGTLVLAQEYTTSMERGTGYAFMNGASLGVLRAKAVFSRIRLERDVYYTRGSRSGYLMPISHKVPPNSYFVMGDNTRKSSDSRYWGFVAAADLVGKAAVVWWPLNQVRPVY